MSGAADDAFLYVPEDEVPEALALGARFLEGEARLVRPRPAPARVDPRAYDRWQTVEARHRWCFAYLARVIGDFAPDEDVDEFFESLGTSQTAHERVYLYVPAHAIAAARAVDGVVWDKRRRMYYAGPKTDLSRVFQWLTPAARNVWESERAVRRAIHLLVKDRARKEVARKTGSSSSAPARGPRAAAARPSTRALAD